MALADKSVFDSPKRKALEEKEQQAQRLLEKREYFEAEKTYRDVQLGLTELQDTYEVVQVVPVRRANSRKAQSEWRALQEEYSLKAPEEAVEAENLWAGAEEKKEQEIYDESIDDYDEAKEKFLAAQIAVADEVARLKARLAASREARAKARAKRLAWLKTVTPKMVDVPAGSYTMGNDKGDDDAKPAHKVTISGFKLSENEITKMRFQAVCG